MCPLTIFHKRNMLYVCGKSSLGKMMAHKFSELREKMPAKAKAESKRLVEKALAEMPLNELRNARGLSQKMLAEALNI